MRKHKKVKGSKAGQYPAGCTIGLDATDDYVYAAVINSSGALLVEDRMPTCELRCGFLR